MEADDHGRSQAVAQFESIKDMVMELQTARDAEDDNGFGPIEDAEQRIREDALTVEVRSNWHGLGEDTYNEEFRILLCTGGPAVQIVGKLTEHNEPESARLEYQDWGTPWTTLPQAHTDRQILVEYASTFYFGE